MLKINQSTNYFNNMYFISIIFYLNYFFYLHTHDRSGATLNPLKL